MHELAITQSVVDTIMDKVEDAHVSVVSLEIGKLSGVVPDAVRFCFDLVTAETPLEGADLRVSEPVGEAHCRACRHDFEPADLLMLCSCGSADVEIVGGQQLKILSVEVV